MLIKTKMALAASVVVGAASAALAGENVNPLHHPDRFSNKAYEAYDLATKPTPRKYAVPARTGSIGIIVAPMPCPLLEGYPDCH
jgi:hypothetical protein